MAQIENPGFWHRPVSRRDITLGTTGVAMIGGLVYLIRDSADSDEETTAQFQLSERFTDTLDFMRQVDLTPAQDRLYGFNYPSTKELSERYLDRLIPFYKSAEADPTLTIFEETRTSYLVRRVRQIMGLEPSVADEYGGYVIRASDEGEVDGLYLNPSFQTANSAERSLLLYHEGLHLFYQQAIIEDFLDTENMPNIGQTLLAQQLLDNKHLIRRVDYSLMSAYQRAIQEDNPKVWEQALKDTYGIK